MMIRVLPEEVLLARLPVYQYRAWSQAWAQAVREAFQPHGSTEEGLSSLSLLTGTPVEAVQRARMSAHGLDELLRQLAPAWADRAKEKDPCCHISVLPGGVMGVEIPVDEEGLRQWLLRRKAQEPALKSFITQDLHLLCQLQVAIEHARSPESVLITGETGTGKGALAEAIHAMSGREGFHPLNCTAIPAGLIESELFGHAKSAFTGATQDKQGLVAVAQNGTLFLDEVGDMAAEVQPKLLRLLREREYRRIGDTRIELTQARFIAATNAGLLKYVAEGRFREDLLQRLSAFHIELPPLRDRLGDVLLVAEQVLKSRQHSGAMTEPVRTLMNRYTWPHNVAELADAMRYAADASKGEPIRISHLPDTLVAAAYPPAGTASQIILTAQVLSGGDEPEPQDTFPESLDAVLDEILKSPPPVANNEEVDQLVVGFVQLAFMWSGSSTPLTHAVLEKALVRLRTISLLSELRQQIAAGKFPASITATLDARLQAELENLKGPPLLGMAVEILMQLLGSDDPADRPKLLEWALKFQKVAPLIAHVAQAFRQNARTDRDSEVTAIAVSPSQNRGFTQEPGTKDWRDPRNKPVVERAVRAANGVQSKAGELLGLNSAAYVAKVIHAHGLKKLCDDLKQASRDGRKKPANSSKEGGD